MVGREDTAEEVLLVLFLTELVMLWDLLVVAVAIGDVAGSGTELVAFDAAATVETDSCVEDNSAVESLSGCEVWEVGVASVAGLMAAVEELDTVIGSDVDLTMSEGLG